MNLHRSLALLAAGALVGLTACQPYGRILAWVTFDPDTERFAVHARVEHVSQHFLDCKVAEVCADHLARFLQGEGVSEATEAVWDLAAQGAEQLQVGVEAQGDALHVLIWYQTWPGTEAARRTGVGLERSGKPGKSRSYLVVEHDDRRHVVSPEPREERVRYVPDTSESAEPGAIRAEQTWLLPPKTVQVLVEEAPAGVAIPPAILAEVPGLREALVARGMLR